jgi:hypothetical protein
VDRGAHGAIENQDAAAEGGEELAGHGHSLSIYPDGRMKHRAMVWGGQ